jgi:predicted AAA+ superfamily ATPase
MRDNHTLVGEGINITLQMLAPYVAQQLRGYYKDEWWQDGVLDKLYSNEAFELPEKGDYNTLVDSLDIARCLKLININWNEIFKVKLTREHRSWANELIDTRNAWAHVSPDKGFDDDKAWRALDTMARLMEQIDNDTTNELRNLAREIREKETERFKKEAKDIKTKNKLIPIAPISSVKSWTKVIQPHPDVAQGRYRQAEFAADLYQVYKGKAETEYQDPVEFYNRTYVTEGMQALLSQALQRVAGTGGEPVIQLKTAFGGGKTHSMLALYHLLRANKQLASSESIKRIMKNANIEVLPKVNVAVIVGTALDPASYSQPPYIPGVRIHTLWGEIAAQLAYSSGNLDAFDLIRDSDRKGVSPGSDKLTQLFDLCGPCLVLIDELVAYARKIYQVGGLPAGSFENLLTFIQEITEAARASKHSSVVASIPESDLEIGGAAGFEAQEIIEHTFGRMESVWKPVSAQEGFEVVRRRLFLPVKDVKDIEQTCRAFSNYYLEHSSDFPTECREVEYLRKMKMCYPIHPEFFDRLYNDWASLESFQRTRGVLRLMATLIYNLWIAGDPSLLIMPSSLLLELRPIRDELTRYLSDGWNAIIDTEIDGKNAVSTLMDKNNTRFTPRHICRRTARTILLGSAPDVKSQKVRGIETSKIRLGVVQPGENIALFNDALSHLTKNLSYLFSNGERYWFDTRPNLRRVMKDRMQQIDQRLIDLEIESRLRSGYTKNLLSGVHIWPNSTADVADEDIVRLVVLSPLMTFISGRDNNEATDFVKKCLRERGSSPRNFVNMLLFLAPDREKIKRVKSTAKEYLAWKSIISNYVELNLDNQQIKEAKQDLASIDRTLKHIIYESWSWLVSPHQNQTEEQELEFIEISGGDIHPVTKAENRCLNNELIIHKWHPSLLKMQLDKYFWSNNTHCSVKEVWRVIASYCYMPRLKNRNVFLETISRGVSQGFFGWADNIDSNENYNSLIFKSSLTIGNLDGILVQQEISNSQKMRDQQAQQKTGGIEITKPENKVEKKSKTAEDVPKKTQYSAKVELSKLRMGSEAGTIGQEIVEHLESIPGAEVTVILTINANVSSGFAEDVVRVIKENSSVLKLEESEFS